MLVLAFLGAVEQSMANTQKAYLGEHIHLSVRLGEVEGVRRSLGREHELDRAFPVASVLAVSRDHFRAGAVCTWHEIPRAEDQKRVPGVDILVCYLVYEHTALKAPIPKTCFYWAAGSAGCTLVSLAS